MRLDKSWSTLFSLVRETTAADHNGMILRSIVGLFLSSLLLPAGVLTFYSDESSWNASVSGVTIEEFENAPFNGITQYPAASSFTRGLLTFSANQTLGPGYQLWEVGPTSSDDGYLLMPVGSPGFANVQVAVGGPITAFAFDHREFFNPCNIRVSVGFADATAASQLVSCNSNSPLTFAGFTSDVAISSILIEHTVNFTGMQIDSFQIGTSEVPEPSTVLYVLTALVACGGLRGKRG